MGPPLLFSHTHTHTHGTPETRGGTQRLQAGAGELGRLSKVLVRGKEWGLAKSEKQREAKAFIQGWAVLGNILEGKEKAQLAGGSHAGGSEVTDTNV